VLADERVKMPAVREERGGGGRRELGEDGVDGGLAEERDAGKGAEGGGEFSGLGVGVGGVAEPGAGFEDRAPLGAGEALFGGELAGLFHAVGEVAGEGFIEEDDGLGGEQAVFGAAETEDIDAGTPGEVGGSVAGGSDGGAGVGEAGAVEVDGEAVGVGEVGEGVDLGRGVDGPVFGGLGEGEGAGFREMDAVAAGEGGGDGGGGEFAVGAGEREELAAAGEELGGAAFVGVDVGDLVAEDALVTLAEGGEGEGIGGGAVEDEKCFAVGFEEIAEELAGAGGGGVVAVGGDGAGVGGVDGGEGLGADAGGVVAGERGVVAGGHGRGASAAGRRRATIFSVASGRRGGTLWRNLPSMNIAVVLKEIRAAPTQAEKNLRAASLLMALFREAGWEMVVVGGSAIEFYTEGDYVTRDLDLCRAQGTRPLPARIEADLMAKVGARPVGTRRQWLLDVLGEVTIDLLGEVETVGVAPCQTLQGPYGAVMVMPVEELLVERAFMATVREPRDEEAWTAAKQLAAVCLSGAVPSDWAKVEQIAAGKEYGIAAAVRRLKKEVIRESKNAN